MSSTLLHIRSPSLFMSQSQQLNHAYNADQTVNHTESKQSHLPYSQQQTNLNDSNTHHHNNNNLDISTTNTLNTTNTESTTHNEVFQPHTPDKIQLKSTNRSSHHEVAADNWRIRYYMNLNLVKQPHLASYRSSSLPRDTTTATSSSSTTYKTEPEVPSYLSADYHSQQQQGSRASIERKQNHLNHPHHDQHNQEDEDEEDEDDNEQRISFSAKTKRPKQTKKKIKRNKTIHVVSRTKSQNNTPPRQFESMLKKHHKKSRLSRLRSRSDGMLSFRVSKRSFSSTDSNHGIEDDDDNDSVSTADSTFNSHHLQSIPIIPGAINPNNLTPPRTSSNNKFIPQKINTKHYRPSPHASLIYQSSRTPPGNQYMSNNEDHHNDDNQQQQQTSSKLHRQRLQQRKIWSEPVGYQQYHHQHRPTKSASIAIRRSRPLSINKQKVKPRFDVDFKPSSDDSYQPSSNPLFNGLTNADSLVDDEANFDMD